MNITEIEKSLRRAPSPTAPRDLKQRLLSEIHLTSTVRRSTEYSTLHKSPGWLRRWWFALASASALLACAVVLAVQQMEIQQLKQSIRALPQNNGTPEPQNFRGPESVQPPDSEPSGAEEIERLKQEAAQLSSEVGRLEQLRTQNEKLQTQLANSFSILTRTDEQQLAQARDRAMCIQCVNNLKVFGLAVKVWALDNTNLTSPDVLSMSNELSTPIVLVCPADTNRPAAKSWSSFTPANCSYEYLAPSSSDEKEPMRVLSRCPIHGNVGLLDGSVQVQLAKDHPERLVERDGKLFMEPSNYRAPRQQNQKP
jgi:hypothetical protein